MLDSSKQLGCASLAMALVLASTVIAQAQPVIEPETPRARGPVPAGFVDCTAEALNATGFVGEDGAVTIANVPVGTDEFRVSVTCTDALGTTFTGYSESLDSSAGGDLSFGQIDFDGAPVPVGLAVAPGQATIDGIGATLQLAVTGTLTDDSTSDITAQGSGTVYQSTNTDIVSVDSSGLLTAQGSGSAMVTATNNGDVGVVNVLVLSAPIASWSAEPGDIDLTLNTAIPGNPAVELAVTGELGDGSQSDLSSSFSGTSYSSSNPAVAAVGADGRVTALAQGSAVITITNPSAPGPLEVPVNVLEFEPKAENAYAVAGFAHDVALSGTNAFVASDTYGLQVLDITTGETTGSLALGGTAVDIQIREDISALALSEEGVVLVDIESPDQPAELARVADMEVARGVALSGERLYVVGDSSLWVYDIADPKAPVLLGSYPLSGTATAVAADSTRDVALVVVATPAIEVVRTGDEPWTSQIIALPAVTNSGDDVALAGAFGYVANGLDGVRKIDLGDLDAPVLLAVADGALSLNALGVAVVDTPDGLIVGAADNLFTNHVPLFTEELVNTVIIDFSGFSDANGSGIALNDFFGVVSLGEDGIQVFQHRPLVDKEDLSPAVSIFRPLESVFPGEPIRALVADDIGVARVDFYSDGVLMGSDDTEPFSVPFSAVGEEGQIHDIYAIAHDYGGNTGTSQIVALSNRGPSTAIKVAVMGYTSCAVVADGTVRCWGSNIHGGLGDGAGPGDNRFTPVEALTLNDAIDIDGGDLTMCALRKDGTVWCWGRGAQGSLGHGSEDDSYEPVQVIGVENAIDVAVGGYHACALLADGGMQCWGANWYGQLGDGTFFARNVAAPVLGLGGKAVSIGVGWGSSCALLEDRTVQCWGTFHNNYLECTDEAEAAFPTLVTLDDGSALDDAIALGDHQGLRHSCALRSDGSSWCWGDNRQGQLGDGTQTSRCELQPIAGLTSPALETCSGYFGTCVRLNDGTTQCMGDNRESELGVGLGSADLALSTTPMQVELADSLAHFACHWRHLCGVDKSGTVWCWGANWNGQLGNGNRGGGIWRRGERERGSRAE